MAKDISSPAVVMVTARAGQEGDERNHVGLTFLWVSGLSGELGKNGSNCFPLAQPSGFWAALKGERDRLRTGTAGGRVRERTED